MKKLNIILLGVILALLIAALLISCDNNSLQNEDTSMPLVDESSDKDTSIEIEVSETVTDAPVTTAPVETESIGGGVTDAPTVTSSISTESVNTETASKEYVTELATEPIIIPSNNTAHLHNYKLVEEKPATCEEDGIAEYIICDKCRMLFTSNYKPLNELVVIEKLGHTELTLKETAVEPTCTSEGKTAVMGCNREGCNYTEGGEPIPMGGHTELTLKETAVEPTCTSEGKTAVMGCNREGCNYTEGGEPIPMSGHTELTLKETAVEPTCTSEGKTAVMGCNREGCNYTEGGEPRERIPHVFYELTLSDRNSMRVVGDKITVSEKTAAELVTLGRVNNAYKCYCTYGCGNSESVELEALILNGAVFADDNEVTYLDIWSFADPSVSGPVENSDGTTTYTVTGYSTADVDGSIDEDEYTATIPLSPVAYCDSVRFQYAKDASTKQKLEAIQYGTKYIHPFVSDEMSISFTHDEEKIYVALYDKVGESSRDNFYGFRFGFDESNPLNTIGIAIPHIWESVANGVVTVGSTELHVAYSKGKHEFNFKATGSDTFTKVAADDANFPVTNIKITEIAVDGNMSATSDGKINEQYIAYIEIELDKAKLLNIFNKNYAEGEGFDTLPETMLYSVQQGTWTDGDTMIMWSGTFDPDVPTVTTSGKHAMTYYNYDKVILKPDAKK